MAYEEDLQKIHNKLIEILLKSPGDNNINLFVMGASYQIHDDFYPEEEYIADIKEVRALFETLANKAPTPDKQVKYTSFLKDIDDVIAHDGVIRP